MCYRGVFLVFRFLLMSVLGGVLLFIIFFMVRLFVGAYFFLVGLLDGFELFCFLKYYFWVVFLYFGCDSRGGFFSTVVSVGIYLRGTCFEVWIVYFRGFTGLSFLGVFGVGCFGVDCVFLLLFWCLLVWSWLGLCYGC